MGSGNIFIRECRNQDLPGIEEIYAEFVQFHTRMDPSFRKVPEHPQLFSRYIEENMASPDSIVLVAVIQERVVGYCLGIIQYKPPVYDQTKYGFIDNLAVLEECQRQGIGMQLYQHTREWFRNRRVSRIELVAAIKNEKSMGFWTKAGFNPFLNCMFRDL